MNKTGHDTTFLLCLIMGFIVYVCGVLNFLVEERVIGLCQILLGISFVAIGMDQRKRGRK